MIGEQASIVPVEQFEVMPADMHSLFYLVSRDSHLQSVHVTPLHPLGCRDLQIHDGQVLAESNKMTACCNQEIVRFKPPPAGGILG